MTNRKNVYFPDHILEKLRCDDSLSGRVTEIIDRYFEMVRRTRIEKRFSKAEMNLMRDACLSWLPEPAATVFGGVALEVEDSLPDGLDKKWGVDAHALIAKLNGLGPGEEVALVEAVFDGR
jgi:hypothetical protein